MRRYVKILLALLYLLQLPIIFRESVLELYKSATEALHRQTETAVEVRREDLGPILKRGSAGDSLHREEIDMRDHRFQSLVLLAYAFFEHGDHHHLPEDGKHDVPRERKRREHERLIANLYGTIRRFSPTVLPQQGSGGMLRLILFPPQA